MTIIRPGKGLTGAQLKWMAIVLMAIDHIGAGILEPMLLKPVTYGVQDWDFWYQMYRLLRCLGRFSFPMFCFLMVEGFGHTRSKVKYMRNLVIFAAVSEVPFDLALFEQVWTLEHQNVFFTLSLGLAAIWAVEQIGTYTTVRQLLSIGIMASTALTAEILATDYGAIGVAVIILLYWLREKPVMGAALAWLLLTLNNGLEIYCFPFIGAVWLYNGQRGRQNKYFFYTFYPAHLLLIYLLRVWLLG